MFLDGFPIEWINLENANFQIRKNYFSSEFPSAPQEEINLLLERTKLMNAEQIDMFKSKVLSYHRADDALSTAAIIDKVMSQDVSLSNMSTLSMR